MEFLWVLNAILTQHDKKTKQFVLFDSLLPGHPNMNETVI